MTTVNGPTGLGGIIFPNTGSTAAPYLSSAVQSTLLNHYEEYIHTSNTTGMGAKTNARFRIIRIGKLVTLISIDFYLSAAGGAAWQMTTPIPERFRSNQEVRGTVAVQSSSTTGPGIWQTTSSGTLSISLPGTIGTGTTFAGDSKIFYFSISWPTA